MNNNPNIRVEETMNSIEDIERAGADPLFIDDIKKRIPHAAVTNKKGGNMWKLAAVLVILFCVNVFSILNYLRTTSEYTRTAAIRTLANEYSYNYTTNDY